MGLPTAAERLPVRGGADTCEDPQRGGAAIFQQNKAVMSDYTVALG